MHRDEFRQDWELARSGQVPRPIARWNRKGDEMELLRVKDVVALEGYWLRMTLTNGQLVERDLSDILAGPTFEPLRADPGLFRQVRVGGEPCGGRTGRTSVPMC